MLSGHVYVDRLSKTLQRYENKSKSQHNVFYVDDDAGCLRLCKDTKIKANHNHNVLYSLAVVVV